MLRPSVILAAVLVMVVSGPASATAPPTTQPRERLRQWVIDLAADDPAVRREARSALLGISADDLPGLMETVRDGVANLPAQQEALREVVLHVYLTGEQPPEAQPRQAFMGVELPLVSYPGGEPGIVFRKRILGFPAYAALEPGDIVLRIDEAPSIDLNNREELAAFRMATPPGLTIHLRVLREGTVVTVPLPLGTAPNWGGDTHESAAERRLERAEAFWQQVFEPAFDRGTS